jgi:hypothetical protein
VNTQARCGQAGGGELDQMTTAHLGSSDSF